MPIGCSRFTLAADLQDESPGMLQREIVAEHLVMQLVNEIRQNRLVVNEIHHDQRNGGKVYADNQGVLPNEVSCIDNPI